MRADAARTSDDWFRSLRERFVTVAARRVEADAVEDVVQDALRIVHEKAGVHPGATVDGRPALAWCFQVLRNVIGNHYQRRGRRTEVPVEDQALTESRPTPLESLEQDERRRVVHEALAELAGRAARCADYLKRVVAGQAPAAIAERENVDAAVIYRRLYRCREQLREILNRRGVLS
jgi:RNA polymerase sigma factor (sigma-70 family)